MSPDNSDLKGRKDMGVLGELYELCTPNLDWDRLFSLIPVHLRNAARELEYDVKRVEEFPSAILTLATALLVAPAVFLTRAAPDDYEVRYEGHTVGGIYSLC
jgi:hypothetical protein